jgi:CRP-like cAMP-binding protein
MRLSNFITGNHEPILNEWEAFAKDIRAAQGMNGQELRDHARQMLETIAKDLATPQTKSQQKEKSVGQGQAKGNARWMLVTHDRVQGSEFYLTHEFLADMLGSQRPSVSVVAATFQKTGVLQYSRGHVQILDRAKLEAEACECYAHTRKQFKRTMDLAYD